jgi:hypothetical protein
MAHYAKGSASGLALLGLAVAGVFAWRKRDQIGAAVNDAKAKLDEKMKAAADENGKTTPSAADIPVSNAL